MLATYKADDVKSMQLRIKFGNACDGIPTIATAYLAHPIFNVRWPLESWGCDFGGTVKELMN